MNLTSWCVIANIILMEWTVKSVFLSSMIGRGGGQLPRAPVNACVSPPQCPSIKCLEEAMGDSLKENSEKAVRLP